MAWKGRTVGQSDFTQLIKALDNSRIQTENNALYQVLLQLVQAAQKNKDIVVTDIANLNTSISSAVTNITNVTADLTALEAIEFLLNQVPPTFLPNARQLLAGTGITFDISVAGELTINGSPSGVSWIPLATGAEPLTFISDGLGQPILVAFSQ